MATEESSFSIWIKQRRRTLDLTQEDLAECVGCSTITVQKIELGERRPSKQVAQRLAQCLQLSADQQTTFVRLARGETGAGGLLPGEPEPIASPQSTHLESGSDHPTNLSSPLTQILGRAQSVDAARDFLLRPDIRLLTFTGAPGIGKTRLSLQVASELLSHFSDGVFFVELAPITDPSLVLSTIAAAVGLNEVGGLRTFLGDKRILLVLDNFEQVMDATPQIIELLSSCPYLKVLVTSREALHVLGEQQFPIPPLDLPDLIRLPDPLSLPRYASIALFLERAVAVDPSFRLVPENAQDIATICTRLEGLPLAIELAAARVKLLSPAAMLDRIDSQLELLAGAARHNHLRNLPPRQQTMRAAIDWSYRLLEKDEQQLLSRLSVFVGGWTIEAAEAVCGPGAADGIEALLEKSLLRRLSGDQEGLAREHRFTMLELVREYALERLEAMGEVEEIRRRHAIYFLEFAERAEPYLTKSEQAVWFQRLEREHSNLRAAISWSLAREEEDIALGFGGALVNFWYNRYQAEGRWWLEGALKWGDERMKNGDPSLTRARALDSAAMMLRKTREYPQARIMREESLRMYRALGDKWGIATSLRWLGNLMGEMGGSDERAKARKLYEESFELFRELGDKQGIAAVLISLGETAREDRNYPQAIQAYEESVTLYRETGDQQNIALTDTNLAYVLYYCGEHERAKALLTESLHVYQEVVSDFSAAWALVAWAGIARAQGDPMKAARLIGAANSLAAPGGTPFDPVDQEDREEIEASIKAELSDGDWQQGIDEGHIMTMDEAIQYALGKIPRR